MKKRILASLTALMLLGTGIVWADKTQELMVNGELVTQTVDRITFEGDNVVLHFTGQGTQAADMDDVELKFIPGTATGVHCLRDVVTDRLDISGLLPGTNVAVLDASGRQVLTARAEETRMMLSAKTLKSGVYLLKAGKTTVKFVKR